MKGKNKISKFIFVMPTFLEAYVVSMAVILMLAASVVCSKTESKKPHYKVHRATAPIKIDGKVDVEEWSKADGAVEFIFPWDSQTGAKQKTLARLLWDDKYLYVAYECDDNDIVAQLTKRDDWVYRDDTVEIFLNVRPAQEVAYYCVEINVRGTIMDYFCANAEFYIRRFQMEGLKTGTQVDGTLNQRDDIDRGWSLELAIPWANFADMARRPRPGNVFTANLNRWDGIEPRRRLSVWADSKLDWPHPHAPAKFGELEFVQ